MAMTLRLNDEEEKALADIKERLGEATAAGAIKAMIMTYAKLQDDLAKMTDSHEQAENHVESVYHQLENLMNAQTNLSEMVASKRKNSVPKRLGYSQEFNCNCD